MKIVIVGAGIAALEAAEAIRSRCRDAEIHLFSREKILPYRRPALTRMISQSITDEQFFLHPEMYYKEKNLQLHLGTEVSSINRQHKTVFLSDGSNTGYDKLLIAAGGRCFIPPIQGTELPQVITIREKAQLDSLHEYIKNGTKNIAVIGGGLLGLEIADNLSRLDTNVTVLEACPAILPRQLDEEGAAILVKQMNTNHNVKTNYGVFISHICGKDKVEGIQTQNEQVVPCELVIICAGLKCNIESAASAGLDVVRAIVVNEHMQTSDPDIYAAGDCASFNNCCYGLWQPAKEQGNVAGANIAGEPLAFNHSIYGARLNAFGTRLFSVGDIGQSGGEYQKVCSKDDLKNIYKKLFFKNRILVGGMMLGDVTLAPKLEKAVAGGYTLEQCDGAGLICR
ncbi:MAG: FAD-dependent oxidoreductase [Lentisphaerota bacterium]